MPQSADEVVEGWNYLPYQVYANSIFGDTVGQSYQNGTDLNQGARVKEKLETTPLRIYCGPGTLMAMTEAETIK